MSTMKEDVPALIEEAKQAQKPLGSVPWTPDEPHDQPHFVFSNERQTWDDATAPSYSPSSPEAQSSAPVTKLALFSWNVDFMIPHASSRMRAAMGELQTRVSALDPGTAAVVFLQECRPQDLEVIGKEEWVRTGFARTDVDSFDWASRLYGTTTLVDRRLAIRRVFRTHFAQTKMERDGLFVDVVFPGKDKVVRFCNTHLESLVSDPPLRPPQVALVAKFMQDESVHGALLAGDLNAIQPFDRTLHSDYGLQDAYLSLGGQEDSEEGYTWGQQAAPELRMQFGCSRMDKVWYCGRVAVTKFARFGADVEVADEKEKEWIMRWGGFEKGWVTDHLGVWAEVSLLE
ncbi:Endonuclease/exonuclease/phosphatase [Nemania sp. FL0031]|nr:Endonuclease/exonuclease/phosphatase [Nemania sp. FL0031]